MPIFNVLIYYLGREFYMGIKRSSVSLPANIIPAGVDRAVRLGLCDVHHNKWIFCCSSHSCIPLYSLLGRLKRLVEIDRCPFTYEKCIRKNRLK